MIGHNKFVSRAWKIRLLSVAYYIDSSVLLGNTLL